MSERTAPRRVAMLSLHTSPLDQPGTGDAGGMNVYVVELANRLRRRDIEVDVFTRATSSLLDPIVTTPEGVRVHHVPAGPFEGLTKNELPGQLCAFAREVLRTEAAEDAGHYDLVHSHYWLSGQVGALARDRWGVPLVHSMHTMAKVKNGALAAGDHPEPAVRVFGEEQVVGAADMLLANTEAEAAELVQYYDADPMRVEVVHPGVDLEVFRPGDQATARAELGLPDEAEVLLFVGRIQPLKAPDVLIRAAARMLAQDPGLRERLVVAVVGGPSGTGLERPEALANLAAELGVADVVRFVPPATRHELVAWFRAASLVCVPSYNESFGLVAVEAQACGTPVVAAAVGGLRTVVADGRTGLLLPGHETGEWAAALAGLLADPERRTRMGAAALRHAAEFSWERTADRTVEAYARAGALMRHDLEGVR